MFCRHYSLGSLAAAALVLASNCPAASPVQTNLFFTGFEYLEGFDPGYVLATQNGWGDYAELNQAPVYDLISNGLVTNVFAGLGQQGWIGGTFVDTPVDSVFLWHPLRVDPVPEETPVVGFSVLMAVEEAPLEQFDFFRWSFYNSETNRLFSLDFENATGTIAYQSDNGSFTNVTVQILPETIYHLKVAIHFPANQWNAWLDDAQIVTNAPVTTTGKRLTLGEIDAVWLPSDPNNRSDKRMFFDNFKLTAESLPTPPVAPTLLTLGRTTNGVYALRLLGEHQERYVIDYSSDSENWIPLKTNVAFDGSFDYVDTNAPVVPERFFRARWLPE